MTGTRRWVLADHPAGIPTSATWRLEEVPLPDPVEGEILIRNRFISVDPGARARLSGDSYVGAMRIGETMDGFSVGVVERSHNDRFPVGSLVTTPWGWQEALVTSGRGITLIPDGIVGGAVSESSLIGVLGVPGLTAWFGLRDIGRPTQGETLLISSAAGAVGSTTGQLGHRAGCRVVGIAGSADKCEYLNGIGFDVAIDRRATKDLGAAIREACPDGVDVYWDNVGGAMLDLAIDALNERGRIVIAGQVSEYNRDEPAGIRNVPSFIEKRLTMAGLVVFDNWREFPAAISEMAALIRSGDLTYREEIVDGFERLPATFVGLFGETEIIGRRLVRLA